MKEKFLKHLKTVSRLNKGTHNFIELKGMETSLLFIGDIHGDREVLQEIERFLGRYTFVFLGDYVDRGNEGVEVLDTLLSWKIELPNRVFLLRGNHEDTRMNQRYGFLNELMWKFGNDFQEVLEGVVEFYKSLPIALFVDDYIVAVHGGVPIPPITRQQIKNLDENSTAYMHILWNDPCDEDYMPRGGETRCFEIEDLKLFLEMVNAKVMIRGHQLIRGMGIKEIDGILFSVFSTRHRNPSYKIGLLLVHPDMKIEKLFL